MLSKKVNPRGGGIRFFLLYLHSNAIRTANQPHMEQYVVSARKYRPTTFASVVGQQSLANTLRNAIASDRLAHAYLFCGGRGVGKTSCARIFAKTINCTSRTAAGEACNECDSCRQFNEGRSLNIIELDAASHNGVEDIKDLVDQVMVPPVSGRYRVFIIDEVHMLTSQAFNAFLKTLEEPPSHAIFILATTEKHKILPTILSRCQIYDFNRIGIADMVAHMQHVAAEEGIQAEPAALSIIARKADGAMRDALSIFDQVAASTDRNITYKATIENLNILDRNVYHRLLDTFLAQDVPSALLIYKEVRDKGFDSQFFINGLGLYMRDLMVAANPSTLSLVEAPDDERAQLAERGAKLHPTFMYKAMELCNDADFNFRQASNKQFLIELTLIRLCQLLSPSPVSNGDGEGRMQPLKAASPDSASHPTATATATAATSAATAPQPAPQPAARTEPAAPKPAPAAAPAAAAPRPLAAPQSTGYALGGMSLRMGGLRTATAQKAEARPAAEAPKRDKPYSEADIQSAWKAFPGEHPAEPLLNSIIEAALPERQPDGSYLVTISAPMQQEILTRDKGKIIAHLRRRLENDTVDFGVLLNDSDLAPAYWPEQRVLEFMLEKHPELNEMMHKFKMRLV